MPARMEHWIKQHPLLTFFGLAYALRWTFEIPALLLAHRVGLSLSNEDNLLHFFRLVQLQLTAAEAFPFILFMLAAGPLFAALFVTAVIEGRAGLRDLGRRIVHWRVSPRWYLVVLGLPLLLSAASLAAGALLGGLGGFTLKLPLSHFVPFVLFMMLFTGLYEEPGWRGFALPHLQRRWSAETSSWILGVMWGLWHLPFTVYYNRANHPLVLIPALIC